MAGRLPQDSPHPNHGRNSRNAQIVQLIFVYSRKKCVYTQKNRLNSCVYQKNVVPLRRSIASVYDFLLEKTTIDQ